jgi:hypothetical protein
MSDTFGSMRTRVAPENNARLGRARQLRGTRGSKPTFAQSRRTI